MHYANAQPDSERVQQLKALATQSLDWAHLLDLAQTHRVLLLLYENLSRFCPQAVPATLLDDMHEYYWTNAFRNLYLAAELQKLLTLFERNSIPALPDKGIALATASYHNLNLREISDTDILFSKHALARAKALLLAYLPETAFQRATYHYVFRHSESSETVELHWRFLRDAEILAIPLDGPVPANVLHTSRADEISVELRRDMVKTFPPSMVGNGLAASRPLSMICGFVSAGAASGCTCGNTCECPRQALTILWRQPIRCALFVSCYSMGLEFFVS